MASTLQQGAAHVEMHRQLIFPGSPGVTVSAALASDHNKLGGTAPSRAEEIYITQIQANF